MKSLWNRSALPQGIGLCILSGWLVVLGATPLLGMGSESLTTGLNVAAIAAGVLLFMQR